MPLMYPEQSLIDTLCTATQVDQVVFLPYKTALNTCKKRIPHPRTGATTVIYHINGIKTFYIHRVSIEKVQPKGESTSWAETKIRF